MNTHLTLDLAKLSPDALSRIRAPFRPGIYRDETVIETHAGWRSASAVCRIDGVRWHPSIVIRPQNENRTHARINAKINVPLAIFGPDAQHALSVHTAGLAALELLRMELAAHGLSRDELDRLDEEDIRLFETIATYFIPCSDRLDVLHLLENIDRAGTVLNPRAKSNLTTEFTVTLPHQGFTVVASACQSPHPGQVGDPPSDAATGCTSHALRIDVQLRNWFTECHRLVEWRDADAADLYESVFDGAVREKLRFNGNWLTHQRPDLSDDKYRYLTPTARRLLSWYLSGNDPRQFKDVAQSAHPEKELSNLAPFIVDWTRIDINIPWKYHATLRCEEMEQILRYTPAWQASVSDSLRYIGDENWQPVKRALVERYEEVLQLSDKRPRERTYAPLI